MTRAEEVLWKELRNHRFHGVQFRRQYPVSQKYILDFYCAKIKLGIEIDGKIHEKKNIKGNDIFRTENLNAKGIRILRFSNIEVTEKMSTVLAKILAQFPPLHVSGEGGRGWGEKNIQKPAG